MKIYILYNDEKIGKHDGLHFYTIGQRKGLKLSDGPFIVIDKENDLVVVTRWLEPNKIGAFMTKIYAALD